MRSLIMIAAALLVSQYGIAQQGGRGGRGGGRGAAPEPPPPADPGFECFERVETPEFPQSALRARIDATVWLRLQVTPQGTADKIDAKVTSAWENGPKLFAPAVEKVVGASKFKPECAGKTVAVVYRYELHGDPVAAPQATEKTEARIMYIESQPELAATGKKSAAAAK
jgi:hypothetical protein